MAPGSDTPERVRQLEGHLRILSEALRSFAEAATEYDRLLEVVAQQLGTVVKDGCNVRLMGDDGWLNTVSMHLPLEGNFDSEDIARLRAFLMAPHNISGNAAARQVFETGEALLIPKMDVQWLRRQTSEEVTRLYEPLGIHSALIVALRARGTSIGLISIFRCTPGSPPLDEQDKALAQMLADHAALAIMNARLYEASQRELAERRRAEAALRNAEVQLQHAQKMEAVGRLAGGVAHDFNNALSVILSYSELVKKDLHEGEPMRDNVEEIEKAGLRGAALTRQLLAFGRQQVLEPRIINVNEVAHGIERMLQRIVGEDVELTMVLERSLRSCKVDPAQLEHVLMNLVVNARDAMPQGGQLTISTANADLDADYAQLHPEASPGPHVLIAVSDTGIGMDKETQARIFEPFFTTKPKDKGTGLGLSTVYGIVKQSGGSIWVYSEPGAGTTFKIYFPEAVGETEHPAPPRVVATARGTETILVVEDDNQVRMVVRHVLRRAGYHIIEAANGGEALLLCEQHGAGIQLLLTDVVMPRMNGRELADRLLLVRPQMKVLFMSGYTQDAVVVHGILQSGTNYLQKPITPDALLRKVRQVLDA